jgi:hypothetical protein
MNQTQRRTALRMIGHLLEHPGTAHCEARDASGKGTMFFSENAARWCLGGAINVVAGELGLDDVAIFKTVAKVLDIKMINLARSWDSFYDLGQTKTITDKLKDYK